MRTFLAKDKETCFEAIMKNEQVAIFAWKIYKKNSKYKDGKFNIYLFHDFNDLKEEPLKLNELKFDTSKSGKWDSFKDLKELNWVTVNEDIKNFVIVANHEEKNNYVVENLNKYVEYDQYTCWNYQLIIKNKHEKANVGFLPEIIEEFKPKKCMNSVFTEGYLNTLTASCPINPENGKEMSVCLNWRRSDRIGEFCKDKLSSSEIANSIHNFCQEYPEAEDCKCINRNLYKDYTRNVLHYSQSDFCWYTPCSSGNYLSDTRNNFNCGNNIHCRVVYKNMKKNEENLLLCSEAQKITNVNKPILIDNVKSSNNITDIEKSFIGYEWKLLIASCIIIFLVFKF